MLVRMLGPHNVPTEPGNILRATRATVVATVNPGCRLQIGNDFRAAGGEASVTHPVVLLARAYRAESEA